MKKKMITTAVLCIFLTACSGSGADGERLTQAIETETTAGVEREGSVAPSLGESTAEETAVPPASAIPSSSESLVPVTDSGYYRIKADIDATKLDMDALEARFRIGELNETSFEQQRKVLQLQKEELEIQKRGLEEPLLDYAKTEDLNSQDKRTLITRLEEYERREDQLDQEEDQLEVSYLSGELTRDRFIEKQASILYEDDVLDMKQDLLEDYLEKQGWED